LEGIRERETSGRVSFSSSVGHYLRLLDFPSDVIEPLEKGEVKVLTRYSCARGCPASSRTPRGS
jgi:hypothetical protein